MGRSIGYVLMVVIIGFLVNTVFPFFLVFYGPNGVLEFTRNPLPND